MAIRPHLSAKTVPKWLIWRIMRKSTAATAQIVHFLDVSLFTVVVFSAKIAVMICLSKMGSICPTALYQGSIGSQVRITIHTLNKH